MGSRTNPSDSNETVPKSAASSFSPKMTGDAARCPSITNVASPTPRVISVPSARMKVREL